MANNNKTRNGGSFLNYAIFFVLGVFIAGIAGLIYIANNPSSVAQQSSNVKNTLGNSVNSLDTMTNIPPAATYLGKAKAPIVAVNTYKNVGIVGNVSVKTIPGSSKVLIDTTPFVETDLQYSADIAVNVAEQIAGNVTDKDFIISYETPADVVGGGSAGAAMTIATIAVLENKTINPSVIMTGTINPDGTIGQIGDVAEKALAAQDAGYRYFLIPEGQSTITYYEKQMVKESFRGMTFYRTEYVPKTQDLKSLLNGTMQVVEVSNINQAMKYFFAK